MKRQVIWARSAEADLARLDKQIARRVLRAISRLAETGYGDVTKLREPPDELRLRVGDWRVRFEYDEDSSALHILHVRHRSQAYGRN